MVRVGSLCTGYGGLDLAVCEVFAGRTVWVSDIDRGANKVLAHRYPDAPNLGDFTTTDWATVEPVDVLTAGFPCQPVSNAGKRRGDDDERWLWDDVAHAVRTLRPRHVVLENVRGLLTARGGRLFGRVLGSLAHLGYDARWHGLPIPNGCHRRFRLFIVATDANGAGRREHGRAEPIAPQQHPAQHASNGAVMLLPTPAVNDMGAGKTPTAWDEWTAAMRARHGNGNGHGKSLAIEAQRADGWHRYAPALERWAAVVGRPPPPPTEIHKGEHQLSRRFQEWMMGLPDGWVTGTPGLTRNEAGRALGNGVVPQQAASALRHMRETGL